MPKTQIRWSRLSGTARHKIRRLIAIGWRPGLRLSDIAPRHFRNHRTPQAPAWTQQPQP